ncbi:unannotated protein [freshwater metagenome]|uniref:Unannotated protein n=1 Tax=freshwater metagenome TaxID=449393 RepID=A0A6J7GPK0_9ZZZZ
MGKNFVQRPILINPLDRGLLAHLGNTGKVVAGFANERRDFWILLRPNTVAFHYLVSVVPREFAHALFRRIEQRDVVIDELNRISVTRYNKHPVSGRASLSCECGQDVVCFEVFLRNGRDVHGVQGVLQQGHLANELGRCFTSRAFVLRVLFGSKTVARDIKRDRHVRRLFLCQEVQHHRNESMDGVGVLSVGGSKTL